MTWLSENKANSTQPFSAFIEVFQKNGEGNAARELQIKFTEERRAGKDGPKWNI
jgi:hypothetical protein